MIKYTALIEVEYNGFDFYFLTGVFPLVKSVWAEDPHAHLLYLQVIPWQISHLSN